MKHPPIQYHSYLKLDRLLESQLPRSVELGKPAHDEMLFIIVHQTYELWFKQILFELDSILAVFGKKKIEEEELGVVLSRLERIVTILHLAVQQVDVLETMTPMDFLEFRDLLYPASGFQSLQFRLLENKLGLKVDTRLTYNQCKYSAFVPEEHQKILDTSEQTFSLFEGVEKWLERTPFLKTSQYNFWDEYKKAIHKMLDQDAQVIRSHPVFNDKEKQLGLEGLEKTRASFVTLFDENEYKKAQAEGQWRLSYQAVHAALFIQLYRDKLMLHLPHRILTALVDIDEALTLWRSRHAQMALRMLGTKIGTGGSSGHKYLKAAADHHKIFGDFFNLSTFYIPRSALPELPTELKQKLSVES